MGKNGLNPIDRRQAGSKRHLIVDGNGTPLNVILTGANRHDPTRLMPLLDGFPAIAGQRGRPLVNPRYVQADRAYDCEAYRRILRQRRICPQIGKQRTEHGSHLGITRWMVERNSPGCISFVACECAMNVGPISTRDFSG